MTFLFVDRILELHPGKQTTGLKHVTMNDVYLTLGQHNQLALLPCVIGEALGQLCSWNVLKTSDFKFRPVGGVVQEIKIHDHAHVGDTILLESNIESLDVENNLVNFSGKASVLGKTLITVKNSLAPLLPLEDFNFLHQVQNDFVKLSAEQTEYELPAVPHDTDLAGKVFTINYDKVISKQLGHEIVAQKKVALTAPYFSTHFPKKPVLPLSLLIEYNLQLAHSFIAESIPKTKTLRPLSIRKIKINNFVLPNDDLTTRISLKELQEDRCIVNFRNEVNNKRVCIAEAEFQIM